MLRDVVENRYAVFILKDSGVNWEVMNSIDIVMDSDKNISAVFEESIDASQGNETFVQYTYNNIALSEPQFNGTIFY